MVFVGWKYIFRNIFERTLIENLKAFENCFLLGNNGNLDFEKKFLKGFLTKIYIEIKALKTCDINLFLIILSLFNTKSIN